MRILRSRRCRYAIALLLTFAVWVAGCWWVMPVRPRNTFATDRSSYLVADISPDNHEVLLTSPGNEEFWDIMSGKKVRYVQANFPGSGAAAFDWDVSLASQFHELRRSVLRPTQPDEMKSAASDVAWRKGLQVECKSENGRLWAHAFKDGQPRWRSNQDPDEVTVFDVRRQKRIVSLRGRYYPFSISPDGQKAVTAVVKNTNGVEQSQIWLTLESLQDDSLRAELLPILDRRRVEAGFYSSDGQYVFVFFQDVGAGTPSKLAWWDRKGEQIATISGKWYEKPTLINSDRVIAIYDAGYGLHDITPIERKSTWHFYDVATGGELGSWESPYLSGDTVICSHGSKYVGLLCGLERKVSISQIGMWLDKFSRWLNLSRLNNADPTLTLIVIDALNRSESMRLSAQSAQLSRDGRLLVTMDDKGSVSVYDLPLRKPWARIFGFAAIGTLGCFAPFALLSWRHRRSRARSAAQ